MYALFKKWTWACTFFVVMALMAFAGFVFCVAIDLPMLAGVLAVHTVTAGAFLGLEYHREVGNE